MDLNLLADNASSKLQIISDALMKRKGFINFSADGITGLLFIIISSKCSLASYGMWKLVPRRVTFIFLFSVVCLQVFVEARWYFILGEILHAVLHMYFLMYFPEEENLLPNSPIWLIYSAWFPPAEFYLDCYLLVTLFFFITEKFADKPHRLSTLICILYAVNYFTHLFLNESKVSLFQDLHLLYVPVIVMYAFNQDFRAQSCMCFFVGMWMYFELSRNDVNSPAGHFIRSVDAYFRDKDIYDLMDTGCQQKSFLNVEEKKCFFFYLILFFKSYIAAYATINIVGVIKSSKLMLINFFLTFFCRDVMVIRSGLIRLLINAWFQYTFHAQRYSMRSSSAIWFWVCAGNDPYHLFLDVFLIVSALVYILKAYEDNLDQISSLICLLWLAEWFSDEFVAAPLGRIMTVATLYLPVLFISANSALKYKHRTLSVIAFILLWFLFKCERQYFENSFKKCVRNTEDIFENFYVKAISILFPYTA